MLKKYFLFFIIILLAVGLVVAEAEAFNRRGVRITRQPRLNGFLCQRQADNLRTPLLCQSQAAPEPVCGNSIVETGEACDSSAPDGFSCNAQCQLVSDEPDNGQTPAPEPEPEPELEPEPEPEPEPEIIKSVVINELYIVVDLDDETEGLHEWVELYNSGNTALSLNNWALSDSEGAQTAINLDLVLAPGEFLLLSPEISIFNRWRQIIPPNTQIVQLQSSIGNGLDNSGDYLVLINNEGQLVDSMSYGEDKTFMDIAAPGIEQSLSRRFPGRDTDSVEDWVEQNEPTPGF